MSPYKRQGAFNVARLQQIQPSVQFFSSNPRNSAVNIRGIGALFGLTNDGIEQGVGFYVDSLFIARIAAATLDFVDVGRIEVLRGPHPRLPDQRRQRGGRRAAGLSRQCPQGPHAGHRGRYRAAPFQKHRCLSEHRLHRCQILGFPAGTAAARARLPRFTSPRSPVMSSGLAQALPQTSGRGDREARAARPTGEGQLLKLPGAAIPCPPAAAAGMLRGHRSGPVRHGAPAGPAPRGSPPASRSGPSSRPQTGPARCALRRQATARSPRGCAGPRATAAPCADCAASHSAAPVPSGRYGPDRCRRLPAGARSRCQPRLQRPVPRLAAARWRDRQRHPPARAGRRNRHRPVPGWNPFPC
ncbi:MAG: TonB-dependent receptor plug domain-containing protein [Sandarakinorhabdus sp.]|nr:TonB-dependent receptor plug domain-containing protein [Sandarakinorhabdus sp.]